MHTDYHSPFAVPSSTFICTLKEQHCNGPLRLNTGSTSPASSSILNWDLLNCILMPTKNKATVIKQNTYVQAYTLYTKLYFT